MLAHAGLLLTPWGCPHRGRAPQLLFEDPTNRTLWLGKAMPREWLSPGLPPVVVRNATTRYGRVSYVLSVEAGARAAGGTYRVHANVTLPSSFVGKSGPPGGLRVRLRAPVAHAGKMGRVTVGGKAWTAMNAKAETIDFAPATITASLLTQLQLIVAEWS